VSSSIKHSLERIINRSGFGVVGRFVHRRDVLILAYHNVLPNGESVSGDTSLHLVERDFVQQLDALQQTHDVVPLASILGTPPVSDRPRAVITFDDAYLGAVTVGVRALVNRGMPATIFVAPGLLGRYTWWDLLADPSDAAVPPALRERFLTEFRGEGGAILDHAGKSAREPVSAAARIASETEVSAAAGQPNITIGSHTWSHSNLQATEPPLLYDELQRSMKWLRERFASFIPWLTYPYGLHSPAAQAAAATAGFTGALRVDGGWLRSNAASACFALPRMNIPAGVSINGFRMRIDGIGPH
jgi:peptidoglycan/xylan/chitin deacetylase (PgdA/CDA1 family)